MENNHKLSKILILSGVIFLVMITLVLSIFVGNKKQTTSSQAAGLPCGDNPVAPPAGYNWKASCAGPVCHIRADNSNDCPPNTTSGFVNPGTSNWCYGFGNSAADWRCLKLEHGSSGTGGGTGVGGGGGTGGGGASGGTGGCFHMEGDVSGYNVTVRFVSDGGDGDSYLYLGDRLVGGPKGWNRGAYPTWTWVPQWTGSPIGGSGVRSVSYRGHVANSAACPGVNAYLTCTVNSDGNGTCGSGTSSAPPVAPVAPTTPPTVPTTATGVSPTSVPTSLTPTPSAGSAGTSACAATQGQNACQSNTGTYYCDINKGLYVVDFNSKKICGAICDASKGICASPLILGPLIHTDQLPYHCNLLGFHCFAGIEAPFRFDSNLTLNGSCTDFNCNENIVNDRAKKLNCLIRAINSNKNWSQCLIKYDLSNINVKQSLCCF